MANSKASYADDLKSELLSWANSAQNLGMRRFDRELIPEFKPEDLRPQDAHYRYCISHDVPCVQILVKPRAKYEIQWTYSTLCEENWDRAKRLSKTTFHRVLYNAFYQNTFSRRAVFTGNVLDGYITGLTWQEARTNARELFSMLNSAIHGGISNDAAANPL